MKEDNSKDREKKDKGEEPLKDDKSKELEEIIDRIKAESRALEKLLQELKRANK